MEEEIKSGVIKHGTMDSGFNYYLLVNNKTVKGVREIDIDNKTALIYKPNKKRLQLCKETGDVTHCFVKIQLKKFKVIRKKK